MNYIYSLHCEVHCVEGVRYVGLTTRTPGERMAEHYHDARTGVARSPYSWMRKHYSCPVFQTVLQEVPEDQDLRLAESLWIRWFRTRTLLLLNSVSDLRVKSPLLSRLPPVVLQPPAAIPESLKGIMSW